MKTQGLNSLILLIFPIALLVMTFYKADFSRLLKGPGAGAPKEGSDFRTQSRMIRASISTFIILHHLVQGVTSYGYVYKGPVTILNYLGLVFTGVFFFFSGYGLIVSFQSKPNYLKTFFSHRILSGLIPFWVANFVGILIEIVMGTGDLSDFGKELLGISLINGNGWFIIELVILYIAFYLLFRFLKNKDLALVLLCLVAVGIMAYSFSLGHDAEGQTHWFKGEWWFNSTLAFPLGLIYARFQDSWDAFFEKNYRTVTILIGIFFILALAQSIYVNNHRGYYHELSFHGRRDSLLTLVAQTAACLLFSLLILLLSKRITIGNKVLKLLGSMSLELFLIHGFFVHQVFGWKDYPDPVYFLAVYICSFVLAYLLSLADSYLHDKVKELLDKLKGGQKLGKLMITVISVAAVVVLAIALFTGRRYILARSEFKAELDTLRSASIGEEVQFGHFDTDKLLPGAERITWIVINKDDDNVRLLSKYGIAGSYYNQKHTEVSWRDSDLYEILNSSESIGAFSKYEAKILSADPNSGDVISLLTVADAKELFATNEERELKITSAALANGTNENLKSKYNEWDMKGYRSSWWWLKGSDTPSIYAPIVTEDGEIVEDKKPVNKPSGAIRPVIWVRLPSEG